MNETGAMRRLGRVLVASGLTAVAVGLFPVASASADPYPPIPVLPTPGAGQGTIGGSEGPAVGGAVTPAPVRTTLGPGEFPVQARTGGVPSPTDERGPDVPVGIKLLGLSGLAIAAAGATWVVVLRRRSRQG